MYVFLWNASVSIYCKCVYVLLIYIYVVCPCISTQTCMLKLNHNYVYEDYLCIHFQQNACVCIWVRVYLRVCSRAHVSVLSSGNARPVSWRSISSAPRRCRGCALIWVRVLTTERGPVRGPLALESPLPHAPALIMCASDGIHAPSHVSLWPSR